MQILSTLLIIVNYELNKSYITQKFCENKNKPKMNCNGKCHLNKQLQKQEKNENAPSNPIKEKNQIQLYYQLKDHGLGNLDSEKNIYAPYLTRKITSPLSSAFHPPQC